jgi:hypothetical protein
MSFGGRVALLWIPSPLKWIEFGSRQFTTEFVKKKLKALQEVCDALREVDDAQIEFGLFRGCLSYNKINHLLRTCPPDLLLDACSQFDAHFQNIVAQILRVPALSSEQWCQASLPVRFAGLGVNQTRLIARSAYIGSCALTRDLVGALLKKEDPSSFEPTGVLDLLAFHEDATGKSHDFDSLSKLPSAQQLLSNEIHERVFEQVKGKVSARSQNLLVACTMPHASDWLVAPPIPALGLGLHSDVFRTALKYRLGIKLYDKPQPCPAVCRTGTVCGVEMDVLGDHSICCKFGASFIFRHNNVRDILGHAARGAGLAAVVIEKKNQVAGSTKKPGDITVQQYHRGYSTSAFDVTISHPLQKKFLTVAMDEAGVVAQEAHDRKLQKSLAVCQEEGIHFVPLAWESLGGATDTVHSTIRSRGGYSASVIRRNL